MKSTTMAGNYIIANDWRLEANTRARTSAHNCRHKCTHYLRSCRSLVQHVSCDEWKWSTVGPCGACVCVCARALVSACICKDKTLTFETTAIWKRIEYRKRTCECIYLSSSVSVCVCVCARVDSLCHYIAMSQSGGEKEVIVGLLSYRDGAMWEEESAEWRRARGGKREKQH